MPRIARLALVALAFAVCAPAALLAQAIEHDDCESGFLSAVGADAYQFSPEHRGELGSVRLFAVLSYEDAAVRGEPGRAFWRLQIRSTKSLVYEARGVAALADDSAKALVEHWWDGHGQDWQRLASGKYRYAFQARFLPDRIASAAESYEDLEGVAGVVEAFASSDELILDHHLREERAAALRTSAKVSSCQAQQHAPLETGFGYNFYYGSTHAHSNFSDGGQPTSSCTSGSAYGSGTYQPADVYGYARNQAGLDFWVINEHNHLINDSVATNLAPVTEAKVRQRYQNGRAAAAAATVDDAFVAIYGMEWGVLTNPDQGHVTLLDTPVLFGWETCSTCNGPNPECTPGTNCYFDVFTPKRFGYLTLYQRSVQNPSPVGPLGILAHPSSGQFDDFAFNANADAALQGIAVRSGLAFSTAANCADANVASTDYSGMWRNALNRGFHVGPTADHDSHCVNYGQGIPTRTVYLIPNGASPVLTKNNLLLAHKARHFFASEDPNAQLVFGTADGAHVMGDIFSTGASLGLRGAVYDPNGDAVQTIELWRGQIGAGAQTVPYRTFSAGSFSLTESPGTGTWYYFVHAVQADGHDLWSSPMWVTFGGGGGDTQAPTTAITAPAAGATVSGTVTVTATASDNVGVTRVDLLVDGAVLASDTTAPYSWSWNTTNAGNGTHSLTTKAYDAATNVGTSAARSVTVSNGISVAGWRVSQANATLDYTIPAGTVIPVNGYLVIARSATKAAFQSFWGVTLASNVVYVDSADTMPQINGSETYTLYNASGTKVEGPTYGMSSSAGQSLRRKDPCNTIGSSASWNIGATTLATPGSGAGAGCAKGIAINEFSDAAGTGNYVYEFVELHNDG